MTPKIVFIGDSITKGTDYGGVTADKCFAKLVGLSCGYPDSGIFNRGVSLDNSTDILNRLSVDAIGLQPDVCVVMAGNNNCYGTEKKTTPEKYKQDLITIATSLRASGIKVVFFSMMMGRGDASVFSEAAPYLAAMESVVASMDIPYLDLYREYCYAVTRGEYLPLYVDSVHQTIAGHQYIADYAMRPRTKGFFIR